MPLPSGDLIKLVWSGPCGPDTWSTSVWMHATATPTQANLNTLVGNALASFNTSFWSAASNPWKIHVGTGTGLTTCRAYYYASGVLTLQARSDIAVVAGTGTGYLPHYVACVFTLRTAGFGRSKRGRMYLPWDGSICASTGQLTLVQANVDNLALVLGGIGDVADPIPGNVVVVSQTLGSFDTVTSVDSNTLPDTQRGRQNKAAATSSFTHAVV